MPLFKYASYYVVVFLLLSTSTAIQAKSSEGKMDYSYGFSKKVALHYAQNKKNNFQLTFPKKDREPILSPDKKTVAFIKADGPIIPNECVDVSDSDNNHADQIWVVDLKTKKEHLLVNNKFLCDQPEKEIVSIDSLQFSPDSKTLYFQTSAWVTSGALHAVNIDNSHQRYLMPSLSFEVVPKGQYQGYLIVQQHRYFIGGGSFNWYWLFTPQGKEDGPLGDDVTREQRDYLAS